MLRSDKRLILAAVGSIALLVLVGWLSMLINPTPDEYKEMIGVPLKRWCRLDHKVVDCDRLCQVEGKWKVCK